MWRSAICHSRICQRRSTLTDGSHAGAVGSSGSQIATRYAATSNKTPSQFDALTVSVPLFRALSTRRVVGVSMLFGSASRPMVDVNTPPYHLDRPLNGVSGAPLSHLRSPSVGAHGSRWQPIDDSAHGLGEEVNLGNRAQTLISSIMQNNTRSTLAPAALSLLRLPALLSLLACV